LFEARPLHLLKSIGREERSSSMCQNKRTTLTEEKIIGTPKKKVRRFHTDKNGNMEMLKHVYQLLGPITVSVSIRGLPTNTLKAISTSSIF
jgi:hypothetical protein